MESENQGRNWLTEVFMENGR